MHMVDMMNEMQDEVYGVVREGMKLCILSILHTHNTVLSYVYCRDNTKGQNKSKADREWMKAYGEGCKKIETVSQGVSNAIRELGSKMEGVSVDMWGKNSMVKSMMDMVCVYIDNAIMRKKVYSLVDDHNEDTGVVHHQIEDRYSKYIHSIESFFQRDIESNLRNRIETRHTEMMSEGRERVKKLVHNGCRYQGYTNEKGLPHTYGVMYSEEDDSEVYRGEYRDGAFDGIGMMRNGDDIIYVGQYRKGLPNGVGVLYHGKIPIYRGQVMDNLKHGIGEEKDLDGRLCYRGNFYNDKRHDFGISYSKDGGVFYMGMFKNDMKHGEGRQYDSKLKKVIYNMYEFDDIITHNVFSIL